MNSDAVCQKPWRRANTDWMHRAKWGAVRARRVDGAKPPLKGLARLPSRMCGTGL